MNKQKEKRTRLFCPYCDEELMAPDDTNCQVCGITVFYCPNCRMPVPRENRACPYCGTEIKSEET